jgi:hypothetical protein
MSTFTVETFIPIRDELDAIRTRLAQLPITVANMNNTKCLKVRDTINDIGMALTCLGDIIKMYKQEELIGHCDFCQGQCEKNPRNGKFYTFCPECFAKAKIREEQGMCAVDDCDQKKHPRGCYCRKHYIEFSVKHKDF